MTTKNKKTCPSCSGAMKYESRIDKVTYKTHTKSFESLGWWCTSCDEAIFEGPELEKAERAFIELRAEVEQVLRPEQIALIRTRLKLSQREAGKVLGGGPRAFQKYESGTVPVSAPMNNLLLLLGQDPRRLTELQRIQQQAMKNGPRRKATARTLKKAVFSKAAKSRAKSSPRSSVSASR